MSPDFSKELDDALCAFAAGEDKGVDLLKQLLLFVPDKETASKVVDQIKDEVKHARYFSTKLKDLDIDCEGLKKNLKSLYDYAQSCVDEQDWVKCMAVQAVIEELAMAAFVHRYPQFDKSVQVILEEVIGDEKRHLAFALSELAKDLDDNARAKMEEVHLRAMEIMLDAAKEKQLDDVEQKEALQIMKKAYFLHKGRLKQIGVELPGIPIF